MRFVILAAGMGMRLGETFPKPMTRLRNGGSIIEQQVRAIGERCAASDQIAVVVGFKKELIMESMPDLLYVYNPRYSAENTAKSLLRALRRTDGDVLWMNGDVVFHPSVLETMLAQERSSMLVNVGQTGDEEVKYRLGADGRIVEVSKSVAGGAGEALGINLWRADDVPVLCDHLERCGPKDYFERGIETAIEAGLAVWPVSVDADRCVEIDFPEDLERANTLLERWQLA